MTNESLGSRSRLIIGALLLLAACSIATAGVLVRAAYERGSEPMSVLALRVAVGAAVAWGYVLLTVRPERPRLRVTPAAAAALGLFGLLELGAQFGEIQALQTLPAALVVLMFALAPVWIAVTGWALWREAVGPRGVAAVTAALVGTIIVVGPPGGNIDLGGVGFAVGGGLAGATALLLYERRLTEWRPQVALAVAMTVCAAVVAVADPSLFADELTGGSARAALVIGSALGFVFSLLLVLYCIQRASAFIASMAATSEPVFASVIAWLALGEVVALHQFAGGALAVTGLWLAVGAALPSARRRPAHDRLT